MKLSHVISIHTSSSLNVEVHSNKHRLGIELIDMNMFTAMPDIFVEIY